MSKQFMSEDRLPPVFGFKDIFTCINLLGGMFAIIFCIQGNVRWAGYSFLLGYLVGDALDGLVARLTNTGNKFGEQFDVISDHLTQCIAPACIVFVSYKPLNFYLAAALASLLVVMGSIRHARGAVAKANFPSAYMGMPRTASAFIIVSFLNSMLFIQAPGGIWAGVPLLIILSVSHILPLPFRTHHGSKLPLYVKVLIFGFFSTTIFAAIFFRNFLFDITFFWLFGYSLTSWMALDREELKAFFSRAQEWQAEIRRAR